eukprot:scaffold362_cov176-Amphora_coffeaeformis.AAC.41
MAPSTTNDNDKNEPYEVVIIGAGPSGLVSAKTLLAQHVAHILVLDESDSTGGLWNRQVRPSVPCRIVKYHNGETVREVESSSQPVYSDLRTNFPKDLTSFLGHPFGSHVEHFPPAETVVSYYQGYGRRFGVHVVTRLQTRVDRCVKEIGTASWTIYTTNTQTGDKTKFTSKRLLVCNGHYRKAYCPYVPGIENYKGRTLHSSAFRSALEFTDQTVLIVGGGISGCDIAKILATRGKCSKIIISTRQWKLYQDLLLRPLQRKGVVARPGVESISTHGIVSFLPPPADPTKSKYSPEGDETLRPDVIIFATGYRYYFPFLHSSTSETSISGIRVMQDDGFKMERLYKRILSIDDQSLAFIGITNQNLSPAIMMEYQARWFTQMVVQEQSEALDPAVMAQEVEARANDPTQDALLLEFPSYCTSLARDIGIRGYWMQLLCDRLPLILQTWWARLASKPWLVVVAGWTAMALPTIGLRS